MYTFIKEHNNYWQLNYNKEFKLYKKVMFLLVFLIVEAWINEMHELKKNENHEINEITS